MNINIYDDYDVIWTCTGGHISQEDSTPGDIVFNDHEYNNHIVMNGGKLLDEIRRLLNNSYLQSFSVIDNEIRIEHFNYNNGESDDYIITVNDKKHIIDNNRMYSVQGKNFHCDCGANVFTEYSDGTIECHGCDRTYKGE